MSDTMREQRICIVGSGVVGQATGRGFLSRGREVVFADTDPRKVELLRRQGLGACAPEELRDARYRCGITMLSVSTPTEQGRINLRFLEAAARDLGARLAGVSEYHLVVVRSTVPPGTTERLVIPAIQKTSGRLVGRDFGICMNPEYLREETAAEDFGKPWIVVIGEYDRTSGDLLAEAYNGLDCPLYRISLEEAEMQKYVHNLFNATKITFFNEMRTVCDVLGINAETIFPLVAESAEGMWNPQYGIKDCGPFAGRCLPKDTEAFLMWARERNIPVALLEEAIRVNQQLKAQRAERERAVTTAPRDTARVSLPSSP